MERVLGPAGTAAHARGATGDGRRAFPGAGHKGQFEMTKLIERIAKGKQAAPEVAA